MDTQSQQTKHTQGELAIEEIAFNSLDGTGSFTLSIGNKWIAAAYGTHVGPKDVHECHANAVRIRDLWNAMQGIDDPAQFVTDAELARKQNKAMRAALHEMIRMYEDVQPAGGWQGVYYQAKDAIKDQPTYDID